ncbi:hypothetical protein [Treponema zioleckii]|uniref:hypothetical protein n=1 Tax=Treponema zioleckii TaxID=331680 RepID=UPI00168C00C9|nr:hypothetical protein [Treponema zioleckii]
MKKSKYILLLTALFASSLFAQEANDGFVVPLNEDLKNAIFAATANGNANAESANNTQSAAGPFKDLKMGLWLETQAVTESLIRNISDHTKKGYEFDNAHWKTEANWWFWGKVSKNVLLSSEISVLNFDKTLYQANSYAANVPDVTWGDGFQSVFAMFASPFKNGNDEGLGYFKKMGVELTTPYVITRLGYGDLGRDGGMSHFDGIFNVIDYKSWNGYTELKNGSAIQEFGDFKVDALLALSDKIGTYGTYDWLGVKYKDFAEAKFTFGSSSTEEQLFFYNRTNTNAFSTYFAVNPLEKLKVEAHLLGTFGTDDLKLGSDTLAYAGRIGWKADSWNASLMQSVAGKNVNSVWGSDGAYYDDINANTATTQLDAKKSFANEILPFSVGLDQGFTYVLNDTDSQYEGALKFRTEPFADFDVSNLLGKNLKVGFYGVMNFDRLSENQDADKNFIKSLDEAGVELSTENALPFAKKTVLSYAVKRTYGSWESGSSYPLQMTYHSIMLTSDVTDNLNVTFGSVIRDDNTDSDTNVPAAFALGASVNNLPLPGHPSLWTHFTYSMFPYTDNNYTLRRWDEENELSTHRSYLLNELSGEENDCRYKSRVSVGLIWNL